jgi:3-hydroxymyristoyl/3-hydroxydecanoyl-(acyl carrier protein) dehydratase
MTSGATAPGADLMRTIDIGRLRGGFPANIPFWLVDRVIEHDPSGRLVATKAVSGSEEFFLGHFPGAPVMPGVLLLEGLAQAAGIWLLEESADPSRR